MNNRFAEKPIKKEGYLEEKFRYFHLRDTAGQERDFHFHEFNKIVILLSGKVEYAVENSRYILHPHDVLLVRHHTIHKALIDKTEPYERVIIYISESWLTSVMPDAGLSECFISADTSGGRLLPPQGSLKEEVVEFMEKFEKCSGNDRSSDAMRETFIMQLLICLGRAAAEEGTKLPQRADGKIYSTLSYINENLGGNLTVEELAARVYLSRYHFMRLFREATGETVHSYIRQRRLLNASRLIREGMSAAEAAEKSGFDDYSAFYRAFRECFGTTPRNLTGRGSRK